MSKDAGRLGADGELTEAAWQSDIVKAARLAGWDVHHTYDSRKSVGDGFPDLVLAKPREPVIYAEIKRWNGRLSLAQCHWLEVLSWCPGAYSCVWVANRLFSVQTVWQEINSMLVRGEHDWPTITCDWQHFVRGPHASRHVPKTVLATYLGQGIDNRQLSG